MPIVSIRWIMFLLFYYLALYRLILYNNYTQMICKENLHWLPGKSNLKYKIVNEASQI